MFLATVTAKGRAIAAGQDMVRVQCGETNAEGRQGASQPGPNHCGGVVKCQQIPKPSRKPIYGDKCRKIIKVRAHRRKSRKGRHHRGQKKRRKSKPLLSEEAAAKILTKKLGSAPILEHYIKRMGVVSIIDRMIPAHNNRRISHGETVAALMVYLLNGGRALYEMEKWAEETAILSYIFPEYQPGDWTDDRIGDTLEELYKAGPELVQGAISANIVGGFGLRLDEIHYDTTSVSIWGTYDSAAGQPAVLITFGHSKAHRPDLKQVVIGAAVSGDGGVPIISGTHDGNTSDSVLPISYWERLRKLAGKNPFCFIGDCKIASLDTLKKLCTHNGLFLTPMAMTTTEQTRLIKKMKEGELNFEPVNLKDEKGLRPIYEKLTDRPGNRRKKDKATEGADSYKVCEDSWQIEDNQGRPHTLRKLVIYSERLAHLNARTRERRLDKAETQLQALRQKLNKRKLITREAIEAAKDKVLSSCKVQGLMDAAIEEQIQILRQKVGRGKPGPNSKYVTKEKKIYDLKVHRYQKAIEEKALLDGIFLMVNNHDIQQWPASRLLALYKRQYKVERNFRVMKGPLAVSPMLLEKPGRICSMIFIMTLALQLYTLIQRQAAQELLQQGSPLDELMPNKIKTWRPQTDKLLAAFDNINLLQISHDDGISFRGMTSLSSLQFEILQILGVPVSKYSLDAFTPKSGEP